MRQNEYLHASRLPHTACRVAVRTYLLHQQVGLLHVADAVIGSFLSNFCVSSPIGVKWLLANPQEPLFFLAGNINSKEFCEPFREPFREPFANRSRTGIGNTHPCLLMLKALSRPSPSEVLAFCGRAMSWPTILIVLIVSRRLVINWLGVTVYYGQLHAVIDGLLPDLVFDWRVVWGLTVCFISKNTIFYKPVGWLASLSH